MLHKHKYKVNDTFRFLTFYCKRKEKRRKEKKREEKRREENTVF